MTPLDAGQRITGNAVKAFPPRVLRRLDLLLVVVWLLTLPATMPLIQPTITRSADGLLHLYRLVALDHAIRQGALFPRWLPDLAYGYGLPLFVFYAPLSYYITEMLNLLSLGHLGAFNASFALALLLSGAGAYLFVKDEFGSRAGVLAGVAYVYAPYQLFNIMARGSLPAAWAGALFPFAFWSLGRLLRIGKPGYLPLSAVTCAAVLLSHNISSLLFLPLLVVYITIELLVRRDRRATLRTGLALGLGLALAAFFLVPAVIEKEFVQVQRAITPPDFDYHFNFVDLKDLFSLPRPANTGLINPNYPFTMGLAQVGLAALGLIYGAFRTIDSRLAIHNAEPEGLNPNGNAHRRRILGFALLGLIGAVFMMLPVSVGVWDRLPIIAFVQQPHRLLSLVALLMAVLVGASVTSLPGRLGIGWIWGGAVLIFVTAIPLLYPRYYDPPPTDPDLPGMMAYEHLSGAIGTTSFGEYLPIWVQQVPRESPLEPMYRAGEDVERLDQAYLPENARIESTFYGFNQMELVIASAEPYQAVFHTFYFPGWVAQVDGQPVSIAPISERGLIGVAMPAGLHNLQLRFRETPVRLVADGLSVLALLIVVGLFGRAVWSSKSGTSLTSAIYPDTSLPASYHHLPTGLTRLQIAALVGLALGLLAVKAFYLDRYDSPLKHTFDGTHVTGADVPIQVNFGNQVNMLGYDLNRQTATGGQTFNLTAYWGARLPLTTDYSALAQLVDDEHHLYAAQDNLHPGGVPTTRWELWGFVRDPHALQVPPGTPPGDYFLVAGLYNPVTWSRLPVLEGGDPGWNDVVAIPVTVVKSPRPLSLADLDITWPVSMDLAPGLRLLGATPERERLQRNDFLRVALFWEATSAPLADYQVSLRLLDAGGTAVLEETARPSYNRYPTTRWVAGERVRDTHALWIPLDFSAGTYRLQARLVDRAGQGIGEWMPLGELKAAD
jgi:hypothetical protein